MRTHCFLISTALCLLGSMADEYASLHIMSPSTLKVAFPQGVMLKPAMFGAPMQIDFNAKRMSGPVAYTPDDDLNGCKPINKTEFTLAHPEVQDSIVMVDRGSCDFVVKVQHVQDLGAKAAIIVDNTEEDYLPYMADDGQGSSITIPSILIRKKDGKTISSALGGATPVIVELSWNIPAPDNNVHWELWTTSADTNDFKRNFDEVEKVFDNSTIFTPHYLVNQRSACVNTSATNESDLPCGTSCTNNGRYCAYSSSNNYTGAAILQEDLRQICLWQLVNMTSNERLWWDYVEQHQLNCLGKDDMTLACSDAAMTTTTSALLQASVAECVHKSKGAELIGDTNELFEKEIKARDDKNALAWSIPQVLINGMPYVGGLECPSPPSMTSCKLLSTLCMGFKNPENITACNTEQGCPLGEKRDVCSKCGGTGSVDACGICRQAGDKLANTTCAGCDSIPNSNKTLDVCEVCGGPGRDVCGDCNEVRVTDANDCYAVKTEKTGIPVWGVILIVVACIALVAGLVFKFMQMRQNALRQDIDALMKQYQNLN